MDVCKNTHPYFSRHEITHTANRLSYKNAYKPKRTTFGQTQRIFRLICGRSTQTGERYRNRGDKVGESICKFFVGIGPCEAWISHALHYCLL